MRMTTRYHGWIFHVMHDSMYMMSKSRQNYSILFIGPVAPGRGLRMEALRTVCPVLDLVAGYMGYSVCENPVLCVKNIINTIIKHIFEKLLGNVGPSQQKPIHKGLLPLRGRLCLLGPSQHLSLPFLWHPRYHRHEWNVGKAGERHAGPSPPWRARGVRPGLYPWATENPHLPQCVLQLWHVPCAPGHPARHLR